MKPATKHWPLLLLLLLLLLHASLQWPHLALDFWNDELFTLERFVCQPFGTAAMDYRVPNNHVFFSLLTGCWTSVCGIGSYADAVKHPVLLRLLTLAFSLAAVGCTYRLGWRISGRWSGAIAGIVLITSIPFWNYGAQMRGYGLGMCLCAMLGNAIYEAMQKPAIKRLAIIALLSLLLLYTLPSNIYFIAAFIALVEICAIMYKAYMPAALRIIGAIGIGVTLAALAYLPLLPQMQRLPSFSSGTAAKPFEGLRERMPVVAYHFLSARYLLLLPLAVFLMQDKLRRWCWLLCVAAIFLLPPLLADLSGAAAPYRVFLTGLPLLAVAVGVGIAQSLSRLRAKRWQHTAIAAVMLYCLATFAFQVRKTEAAALRDIKAGVRSGDLYFQYNLHYFHPRQDAEAYMRLWAHPGIPLVECCRMDAELLKYLSLASWNRMAAKQLHLLPAIAQYDTVDVLIERPSSLNDSLQAYTKPLLLRQLLHGPRPVQIIRLTKR